MLIGTTQIPTQEILEQEFDVAFRPLKEVDYSLPGTLAIYRDYNWRDLIRDRTLPTIPFEKRVLLLLEPSSVNPAAYVVPWLRNRFSRIITWDKRLLSSSSKSLPIVVNPFEEPPDYPENRFADISFSDKKPLVAIAARRINFMPWSNYARRNRAYRYFDRELPADFDLYGNWWRERDFKNVYRGALKTDHAGKVATMARYRFALCYENNANQPGYVSEKISDCICARCVPIYHGSEGIEERVPPECFVNARRLKSLHAMKEFILSMTEAEHRRYLDAMDDFCKSDLAKKFTRRHFADCLARALGLQPKSHAALHPVRRSNSANQP